MKEGIKKKCIIKFCQVEQTTSCNCFMRIILGRSMEEVEEEVSVSPEDAFVCMISKKK